MRAWRVVLILSAAQFILVLDTTVMNVSISNVVADLGTPGGGDRAGNCLRPDLHGRSPAR